VKHDPHVRACRRCTNELELEISSRRKEVTHSNRELNINISNTSCTDVSGDNTVLRVGKY